MVNAVTSVAPHGPLILIALSLLFAGLIARRQRVNRRSKKKPPEQNNDRWDLAAKQTRKSS